MKKRIFMAVLFLMPFTFSGCLASLFSIGEVKTKCEEKGVNYADAGLCLDPYSINKYKSKMRNSDIYGDVECH